MSACWFTQCGYSKRAFESRRVRLVVRTQPSQGWCTGSTPVRAAIAKADLVTIHHRFSTNRNFMGTQKQSDARENDESWNNRMGRGPTVKVIYWGARLWALDAYGEG